MAKEKKMGAQWRKGSSLRGRHQSRGIAFIQTVRRAWGGGCLEPNKTTEFLLLVSWLDADRGDLKDRRFHVKFSIDHRQLNRLRKLESVRVVATFSTTPGGHYTPDQSDSKLKPIAY